MYVSQSVDLAIDISQPTKQRTHCKDTNSLGMHVCFMLQLVYDLTLQNFEGSLQNCRYVNNGNNHFRLGPPIFPDCRPMH